MPCVVQDTCVLVCFCRTIQHCRIPCIRNTCSNVELFDALSLSTRQHYGGRCSSAQDPTYSTHLCLVGH
jgi:hypothetical protein